MRTAHRSIRAGAPVAFLLAATVLCVPAPVTVPHAAHEIRLENVTVIHPGAGRRRHVDVVVKHGRIETMTATRRSGDGRFTGAFVTPGLIDMHVHYWSEEAEIFGLLMLAHGVTTVRDVGDGEGSIFDTRRRIERGDLPGPRLFACGPMLDGDPPVWPGSRPVTSAAEAHEAVRALARQGADCVKVYRRIAPEPLAAVRDAARAAGMTLVGHVPDAVTLEGSGLDDVQHLSGVAPRRSRAHGTVERVRDLRDAWRAVDAERLEHVRALSKRRGIAHTPTLVFWERFFRLHDPDLRVGTDAQILPADHRELLWHPHRPWNRSRSDARTLEGTFARMKETVRALHQGGVRIHAGTDALNPFVVPGQSLHAEIQHLVDAGLSPEDALASATRSPAASLGHPGLGELRIGGPADLIVLRGDPTRDLEALSSLEAVMVRGRLYTRAELENALGDRTRPFTGAIAGALRATIRRVRSALGFSQRRL